MASILFFKDTATSEIYTLSLHNALPICRGCGRRGGGGGRHPLGAATVRGRAVAAAAVRLDGASGRSPGRRRRLARSEEHTSELQSRQYLVCPLLLAKSTVCAC